MKFYKKVSSYLIVAVFSIAFAKVIFDTYTTFFNKTGENKIIHTKADFADILAEKNHIKQCQIEVIIPNDFHGENLIKFTSKTKEHLCEELFFQAVSKIFLQTKVQRKFLRLSAENTTSQEVSVNNKIYSFKIHTIFVKINRSNEPAEITITFKNLNKKNVQPAV